MGYVLYSLSYLLLCHVSLHTNHSDGQMHVHFHLPSNPHSTFVNVLLQTPGNCLAEVVSGPGPESSHLVINSVSR